MYGFSNLPDAAGIVLVVAGTLVLIAFVWWEYRTPGPLINLSLFLKNRVFAFSSLAALINYAATFSVTFFLSFYLQYIRGFFTRSYRHHSCHPAGCTGSVLFLCRQALGPYRAGQDRISRNGDDGLRVVSSLIYFC